MQDQPNAGAYVRNKSDVLSRFIAAQSSHNFIRSRIVCVPVSEIV